MALTHHDMLRTWRLRIPPRMPPGPTVEFARAAAIGGVAVAGLAIALSGATPGIMALTVTLYAMAVVTAGWLLHRDYPHGSLGLCNLVTLGRLVLVASLVAPLLAGSGPSWAVFAVATLALCLDGLDGWIARHQDRVSNFGARFDMEVDSLLALVLALGVAFGSDVGLAAILLGLPRYAFAAAGIALPWMRRALPERFSRKAVCVVQLGSLIALQAPILPPLLASVLVPVVAASLVWSFAVDVIWLWRRRA